MYLNSTSVEGKGKEGMVRRGSCDVVLTKTLVDLIGLKPGKPLRVVSLLYLGGQAFICSH